MNNGSLAETHLEKRVEIWYNVYSQEIRTTVIFKECCDMAKMKWGLFSDYGMRILNETFATKREAQKAFREYGYTKDSEAWIERVPMDAKGRFER